MGRLTQWIILPDGEVKYFIRRCNQDCINDGKCISCPIYQNVLQKLGEYEDISNPAYKLIKELGARK